MTDAVTLGNHSNVSLDQATRDAQGRLETYRARIIEQKLSAEASVYSSDYGPELPAFFKELATAWRGWVGEKTWRSLEGELWMSATSDSLGHITIEVNLQPSAGPDVWRAITYVHVEAGQLDYIHSRLVSFFADQS